jgi:hypothetical protein
MENSDIYYEELEYLKECLDKQPDKNVKHSIIKEPYKKYFIKSYRALHKLLKKAKLTRISKNSSVLDSLN